MAPDLAARPLIQEAFQSQPTVPPRSSSLTFLVVMPLPLSDGVPEHPPLLTAFVQCAFRLAPPRAPKYIVLHA